MFIWGFFLSVHRLGKIVSPCGGDGFSASVGDLQGKSLKPLVLSSGSVGYELWAAADGMKCDGQRPGNYRTPMSKGSINKEVTCYKWTEEHYFNCIIYIKTYLNIGLKTMVEIWNNKLFWTDICDLRCKKEKILCLCLLLCAYCFTIGIQFTWFLLCSSVLHAKRLVQVQETD